MPKLKVLFEGNSEDLQKIQVELAEKYRVFGSVIIPDRPWTVEDTVEVNVKVTEIDNRALTNLISGIDKDSTHWRQMHDLHERILKALYPEQ